MMLGVGEMGPVNMEEYLFCIVVILMSLMLQSLLFGDIAVLVTSFYKSETQQQEEIDKAFEVMTFIELDEEDQSVIREYISSIQSKRDFVNKYWTLLKLLPSSLSH